MHISLFSYTSLAVLGLAATAVLGSGTPLRQPELVLAAAESSCARWAATNGDDAAPGTKDRPFRSLQKLVAALDPGQTGCLPAGQVYEATAGNGIFRTSRGTPAAPVTLTSGGTVRAKVRGWILAEATTHDVVVTGLDFLGSPADAAGNPILPKSTHINLLGDRLTLRDNDITNPHGICVNAGRISAFQQADPGEPSDDIVITGNRVHGCGMSPKLIWSDSDSGAHGIYLVNTRRARVVENLIFDNRYRGFQQWPTGSGTLVANNLFVRNATHVNVGSALTEGWPWWSTATTVRDNVMTLKTNYRPEKNQASVAFNYPKDSPTYGNTVTGNCLSPAAPALAGFGYTAADNTSATPTFVDAPRDDFRLTAASPCRGKGPRTIQPVTPRSISTASAACAAGVVVSRAPTSATHPTGDWLWFRVDLYRWDGSAWVVADRTGPWLYNRAGSQGLLSSWVRHDTGTQTSSVTFDGLTAGSYYAAVQTLAWNSDRALVSSLQPMTGSTSSTWCRA